MKHHEDEAPLPLPRRPPDPQDPAPRPAPPNPAPARQPVRRGSHDRAWPFPSRPAKTVVDGDPPAGPGAAADPVEPKEAKDPVR